MMHVHQPSFCVWGSPGYLCSGLGGGGGSASVDWLSIISRLLLDWSTHTQSNSYQK